MDSDAVRQTELYRGIWASDQNYGTRWSDVTDTVVHRIIPHIRRLGSPVNSVVDFGAGDGRFLKELRQRHHIDTGAGVDVYQPPIMPQWMTWYAQPLWEPLPDDTQWDYVISTDTLEHLPIDRVQGALTQVALSAPHGFLRIATKQDIYGTERGLHLHETVKPPEWWCSRCSVAGIDITSVKIYFGQAIEIWF